MFVERASELERLAQNYTFDVAAVEHLSERYNIVQMAGACLFRAIVESAKSIIILHVNRLRRKKLGVGGRAII